MNDFNLGIVAIGRNEGERLKKCIASLLPFCVPVVYVDSGSTDGSVEFCRGKGVDVVQLDMSLPFTAARARNEGFQRLVVQHPEIEYVQFIDGDCQLDRAWLETAVAYLVENTDFAVASGRRREVDPSASIYNMLCDIEWDTPLGETNACGGDALFRVSAFHKIGGFRSDLIAGEEPELCHRLIKDGWKIIRLNAEMTLHDANITRFRQWWRRAKRGGYAYTKNAWIHNDSKRNVVSIVRFLIWGFLLPALIIVGISQSGYSVLFIALYFFQYLRLQSKGPRSPEINRYWAGYMMLAKFAEFTGFLKCVADLVFMKKAKIIEYK